MADHPLICSPPMVRALLAGRKTQTRRIIRGASDEHEGVRCPQGQPGDRLWVREVLRGDGQPGNRRVGITRYGTDGEMVLVCCACGMTACLQHPACDPGQSDVLWRWRRPVLPARFMPRWASRITLELTGVRVEQLQDLSDEDARAEGADSREAFIALWGALHAKTGTWDENPLVRALEFRTTRGAPDAPRAAASGGTGAGEKEVDHA